MTHIPLLDLGISVLIEIQFTALVFYYYRRADIRVPTGALPFIFVAAISILNAYGIESHSFALLPKKMDLFVATLVPTALVVASTFIGALWDRSVSRYRWWDRSP